MGAVCVSNPGVNTKMQWVGVTLLVVTVLMWSLNGPLIKLLCASELDGVTIAFYRSLFGGLIFLIPALRRRATLKSVSIKWPVFSVVAFTLMTVCFVVATAETAAANAIILQNTSPVWVFLLSPLLLGERLRLTDGMVLLLAMIGVAIIFFGHGAAATSGLVLGLASGLGYGSLIVALRGLRSVNPNTVVALNCLGSAFLLLPAVAIWGTFRLDAYQFWLVLMLGVVQFAIPYAIFSWAIRYVQAHHAALIVLLETMTNPLLTFLIIGEIVPRATLIGGPFILASVVGWLLLSWKNARRGSSLRRVDS